MVKLKEFKVICNSCGGLAVIEDDNNHACGDPECCGSFEEWFNFHCEKCDISERVGSL